MKSANSYFIQQSEKQLLVAIVTVAMETHIVPKIITDGLAFLTLSRK